MLSPNEAQYAEDEAHMTEMLELFKRETLSFVDGTLPFDTYDKAVGWDRILEADGRHFVTQFPQGHAVMSQDIGGTSGASFLSFVGFFGHRVVNVTPDLLSQMNQFTSSLCALLCDHPDILLYGYAEVKAKGDYYNLVVLRHESAGMKWRDGALHQQAVNGLSPKYYTSIRIHTGDLPDGLDSTQFNLKRSVLLDYTAHQKDPNAPIQREVKLWTQ
ncbi:uncharacterized protein [Asterias amurensis]|uniref:uncharacterized protein isoform X2 n=1 Tax=Asterias amurensis TaxID=7602 RepID=UPI003AB511A8